jgi:hypothetical protein
MATEYGPALGVSTADFNRDGWIDIYVANDGAPTQLWINQGARGQGGQGARGQGGQGARGQGGQEARGQGGQEAHVAFKNTALLAGAGISAEGRAKASMGVDAGDFDADGDDDLFIGELTGQGADLYVNDGSGVFTEASAQAGLRLRTLPFTGFGAAWFDADNDGLLDLAVVNGAVTHTAEALAAKEHFRLQQRRQLFHNVGKGRFEEITARAGPAFSMEEVGRGAAFGDLDNDGDTDIVVSNDNGPVRVLVNEIGSKAHWIGLRLLTAGLAEAKGGGGGGRDALGARVAITRGDGVVMWRRARADGSYASANDPRVLAGLGATRAPVTVRVYWPGGRVEEWTGVAPDGYASLREGGGRPVAQD